VRNKQFNAQTLPDLQTMLFCGEVLSKSLLETLWQRFPDLRIINTYGPTECTVAVTAVEITRAHLLDTRPLPIGYARQGTKITGATGSGGLDELVITGRAVGLGYLGDAAKQAKSFPMAATYMTGDWGQAFDDLWYFDGRKDREIKLHGHRIDLNTVEAALRATPGVEDAVVDVHPNNRGLRAFVLGQTTPQALEQTARHLVQTLAAPMVPRFWYGSTLYPLNANSKLDRKAFIAQLQDAKPLIFSPPLPALVSQTVPDALAVAG
jgi:D-alanine--poly(phosphoribitol) ligase subunit 1